MQESELVGGKRRHQRRVHARGSGRARASSGSDDRAVRGFGISQVIEKAFTSRITSAALHIRSCRGKVLVNIEPGAFAMHGEEAPYKKGTWVTLELGPLA